MQSTNAKAAQAEWEWVAILMMVLFLLVVYARGASTPSATVPPPQTRVTPLNLEHVANATSVRIATDRGNGSGYIAIENSQLMIFTIYHVIENTNVTLILMPGLGDFEIPTSDWTCPNLSRDSDSSCFTPLPATFVEMINQGAPIQVVERFSLDDPVSWRGYFVTTPRWDIGDWTLYKINGVTLDGTLSTESVLGNYCHGRSGGPALLLNPDRTFVLSTSGRPVVIGEIERGLSDGHYDYAGTDNVCYSRIGMSLIIK